MEQKKKEFLCQYLISDGAKRKCEIKKDRLANLEKLEGKYECFYFPSLYDIQSSPSLKSGLVIDSWPAHASSRSKGSSQMMVTSQGHMIQKNSEKSKLPPVRKPRFLEILEARINKEKARLHVSEEGPDPLRLQIYREIFAIFIQTCVYYGPLLAKIKAEYEIYLVHIQDELKKLQPIKELLWTVSQECENRVNEMRRRENKDIKILKGEKKLLRGQIAHLQEDATSLTCEVEHLTQQLEKTADDWRIEADGRKMLVTEVNELTSRLKEMESMARAEANDEQEDPKKLRIALDQANKSISSLQSKLLQFETDYESQVPRTKYEEVKQNLESQIEETNHLREELESIQSRYDLLQDHCVNLSTYRDLYYLQVTYASRLIATKGDPSQKVDYVASFFAKWRRLQADKPWSEFQRIVGDEIVRMESGQTPVMVRASRGTRHRGTIQHPGPDITGVSPGVRDSLHKSETG